MNGCPILEINLDKITENTKAVVDLCGNHNIDVLGVTKGFSADPRIVEAIIAGNINGLADARMENIVELRNKNFCQHTTLLRIPRLSNVDNVVKYADASVNSELTVIRALSKAAIQMGKVHDIILMVDLGDLREGIMQENVLETVLQVNKLSGVSIVGLGTNMGCFGGVLPSVENLKMLIELKGIAESYAGVRLRVLSGGGTSTLLLVENRSVPAGINQLRIGEGILLGTDTTNNRKISWLHHDAFRLRAEVIEVKEKPSVPIGEIGKDAFGNTPHFADKGIRKRAILALGKQDVYIEGIYPKDRNCTILGASSDHTIVDITERDAIIKVGDKMEFGLTYSGLLSSSASRYIIKKYRRGE